MRYQLVALSVLAAIVGCTAPAEDSETIVLEDGSVLEKGYQLPKGFTSIVASKQPNTGRLQIDAIYEDPTSGNRIRFITARGSYADMEPGSDPIDLCIRDEKTGRVVSAMQSADAVLIKGCRQTNSRKDRSAEISAGAKALKEVKFKRQYLPEYRTLVAQEKYMEWLRDEQNELNELLKPGDVGQHTGAVYFYDPKTGKPVLHHYTDE